MPNMFYCRFRNTLEDLKDCAEHIGDDTLREEARAKARLVKECYKIVEPFLDENGELDEEMVNDLEKDVKKMKY